MAFVACMALASMANAGLMSSSRFPLAMARDRHLPEFFTRINSKFGTPVVSILFTGGLLILFILVLPVKELAKLASAFQLIVFSMENMAVIVFRESDIEWYKPEFESPLYPYIQITGVIGTLGLLGFMGLYDVFPIVGAAALIVFCMIWYFGYARDRMDRIGAFFRKPATQDEVRMFERARTRSVEKKESVIVPFFGLKDVDILHVERRIRLAAALCDRDERLDVVDFVEVPEQSFLSDFEAEPEEFEALEQRTKLLKNDIENEIHLDQVITHSSRGALLNYAREENPHWVVFDWKKPSPWKNLIGQK
ncbi:MAG: APC family permease [bacterium]